MNNNELKKQIRNSSFSDEEKIEFITLIPYMMPDERMMLAEKIEAINKTKE
jgi:hypothetical protein